MRRLCPYCFEDVHMLGEDLIDVCVHCEVIVEGETLVVTDEEAEVLCA